MSPPWVEGHVHDHIRVVGSQWVREWSYRHSHREGDAILPARVLDRRLQVDWARDAREGPRVLMSLRVDFGPMG